MNIFLEAIFLDRLNVDLILQRLWPHHKEEKKIRFQQINQNRWNSSSYKHEAVKMWKPQSCFFRSGRKLQSWLKKTATNLGIRGKYSLRKNSAHMATHCGRLGQRRSKKYATNLIFIMAFWGQTNKGKKLKPDWLSFLTGSSKSYCKN